MEDPIFSKENVLFCHYCCSAALLTLKVLFVGASITLVRTVKRVTPNPEDARFLGTKPFIGDPTVERLRRAHLNDLENIPAFLFVAFLYTLTGPNVKLAQTLIWTFTLARFVHTLVYAYIPSLVPQPLSRVAAFALASTVTFLMAIQVLVHFL